MHIKLNENENSGLLYAIAYCEDPDIYSEEFWGWDTESDVGYELMEFGSLIQDADVFDSLEAAEDRADDVLSSIFEDEVFIVGLDPYTPHNLTGFVKKIIRDSVNESKSMDETIKVGDKVKVSTPGNDYYNGRTGVVDYTEDGIVTVKFDDNNSPRLNNFDLNQVIRINESKSIKEDIAPNTMKEIEWLLDGIINIGPDDKINDQADWKRLYTTASRIKRQLNKEDLDESKSIKESATGDYIEVAYICDGFTNFRVFGGGFKTSDALVSVEDEKGKRLRLTMGDVCEFYTWYDAKGNVIHEPGYIDTDTDYKGIKTITLNADAEGQKIVLTFDTFEDVYKHFENLYMNATDENYAEESLYSIMCSASANEYDYIDEDGFAVIEVDATSVFSDTNLNENYVPEYGDEFPNMNAAMYVARSLVYYFVSNPDDAEKLYAKAESDGWESSELVALCDLIGDALEASNYHSEARDYFYDKFPYWWAFDVSAEDEAKMDELIESCDDDNQRMQLLIIAVNSLVLELD